MSLITDEIRSSASEIYNGDDICQVKSKFLLTEMGLPNGLLPLQDIEECGYVKDTGFVWLKQKKKCQHKFEKIGRHVQYATEVTAYVELGKIKKLTGVKAKELLVWMSISDIYVDDPPTGKITFKSPTGFFRSFPVAAFQLEEEPVVAVKDNNEVAVKEVKDNNEVNVVNAVEVQEKCSIITASRPAKNQSLNYQQILHEMKSINLKCIIYRIFIIFQNFANYTDPPSIVI
ncbi:hypothetical protein ACJIZ3_000956 [Penstemon smallii]|uniref:Uncharacterized protein n=1 Tax=Penstemon smallii TaxID=265156 RepID=A0ABD3U4Y5_9LAMI